MKRSTASLDQSTHWDPLDLSEEALTSANHRAVVADDADGPGILPDVDTRPELRPVRPVTNPWGTTGAPTRH